MKKTLILISLSTLLQGQVFTDNGFGAAKSAGSGGSGGAFVSDIWSYALNPAGYAGMEEAAAAFSTFNAAGQDFTRWNSFSAGMSLGGDWGYLAVHGDQSAVDYGGRSYGNESALALSHAFYLQKDLRSSLRVGYSVKTMSVDYGMSAGLSGDGSDGIDLGSGTALGLDVGLQGSLRDRTWVGVMLQNVNGPAMGNSSTVQKLPRKITTAMAYSPYYGLVSSLAVEKEMGRDYRYRAGIEHELKPWLTLRSGIATYPSQLSLGAALAWKGFQFDYAFISHPVLPATQMFDLSFALKK